MSRKMLNMLALFCMWIFVVQGCGGASVPGDDGGNPDDPLAPQTSPQIPTAIEGVVQKGPLNLGSSITVQELNSGLSPTTNSYEVQTEDNTGNFELEFDTPLTSPYVEVIGEGYYFNEVTGDTSDGQITLRSISDISANDNVKVNILTTLTKNRIIYLLENVDMSFSEARTEAETGVADMDYAVEVFNGEIWMIDQYLRHSVDGISWSVYGGSTPWDGDLSGHETYVFDDKLFVVGGVVNPGSITHDMSYLGNYADQ